MKKAKRMQIACMTALLLLSCLFTFAKTEETKAVVVTPQILQVVQSDKGATSIGVAWEVAYTDWVEVWIKESIPANKNNYRRVAVLVGNSYVISGLASGTTYDIMLVAVAGVGSDQKKVSKTIYGARTSLGEMKNVYQVSWDRFTNTLVTGWDKLLTADGYEIYFETADEKTKILVTSVGRDINSYSFKIKNNRAYKFSVRAFVLDRGSKTYTGWHSIICLEQPWVKSAVKKSGKLNVKWQKVKGADGYEVYVSDKPEKGYVKAKTVKGSVNSVSLKKAGKKKIKKKKVWYVYVVAKRGGNTSGKKYYFNTADGGKSYQAFS